MKKEIILATVIAFTVSYLLHAVVIYDFNMKNWARIERMQYLWFSIFLSLGFSVMGYVRKKIDEL